MVMADRRKAGRIIRPTGGPRWGGHPRRPDSKLLLALLLGLAGSARVVAAPPKPAEPVDRKPYAIRASVGFEAGTRVDPARRSAILDEWQGLVRRFVGEPWALEVVEEPGAIAASSIEDLKADAMKPLAKGADKAWAIRARAAGPGYVVEGRELDSETGALGEVHRREVAHSVDAPRELFHLARSIFAPTAEVGESKGGGVSFLVRGGSLLAAGPLGEVAPAGTVFRALRLFLKPDDSVAEIREIPYSYFRVERLEGAVARCEIIKGVGDPLTGRYARKNKLVALGIKPASAPTRLRFLIRGDRQPAAGYKVTARSPGAGTRASDVGITDREGRISLPAGFAAGLVMLRVVAGDDEPMADVPVMPGETRDERTIVFEARPLTLTLEARLEALRDAIVDVVAVRSRLESRMKARVDGEDWPGLAESIKEFRRLTPREQFIARLDALREDAQRREAELKTTILTKNARAHLDDTKALIDRYLDDDAIRSYEDAAERAKAEVGRQKAEAAKPKARKKGGG